MWHGYAAKIPTGSIQGALQSKSATCGDLGEMRECDAFSGSITAEPNMRAFRSTMQKWKDLVAWILDCSPVGLATGPNLCSIMEPLTRFPHLQISSQRLLTPSATQSPLSSCSAYLISLSQHNSSRPFLHNLLHNSKQSKATNTHLGKTLHCLLA